MSPQCERVLAYMREFGAIEPMEAWRECGVYRLAARVSDLKRAGYNITKQMVDYRNRFGETVRVAEYREAI